MTHQAKAVVYDLISTLGWKAQNKQNGFEVTLYKEVFGKRTSLTIDAMHSTYDTSGRLYDDDEKLLLSYGYAGE